MASEVDLDVLRFSRAEEFTMLARIGIAAMGGALIGFERRQAGKSAGMRTLMLVSMGAALFTLVSIFGFQDHDPSRVASGVVAGVGFLGAGAILRDGRSVRGLTTAASVWVSAAVGAAAGTGLYIVALGTALLAVFVMWLWPHDVPELGDGEDTEDPPVEGASPGQARP
ncbi:MAG: MgtC/SapB family protein [Dehalococcoidia bacterium]